MISGPNELNNSWYPVHGGKNKRLEAFHQQAATAFVKFHTAHCRQLGLEGW